MSTTNTSELEVGDIVDGRYRICGTLGRGGLGTVYEAEHIGLHRHVALKVLRSEILAEGIAAKRFEREATAASSIDQCNVITILGFGRLSTGESYYAMELLQGRDLSQLLRETGALPWSRAGWIILQVVRALVAIHAQGIIHRDVKPANCFLLDPKRGNGPDYVKICDFGIALQDGTNATSLTATSDIIGSVLYMAPEQCAGERVDSRTDIYSLGVMMYELLTGQVPFRDSHIFMVMLAHMKEEPRPPRELVPDIPPEVEAVILRAMAKAPNERFQTTADIEAALGPLVEIPWTIDEPHTASRPAARAPQRRVMPLVGVLVVLVVALLMIRWIGQDELDGAPRRTAGATTAPASLLPPTARR